MLEITSSSEELLPGVKKISFICKIRNDLTKTFSKSIAGNQFYRNQLEHDKIKLNATKIYCMYDKISRKDKMSNYETDSR